MELLKARVYFTPKFEKYLSKSSADKPTFKKHLKRVLEGKIRKGETLLPKKNLGKNLKFFKGRVEEGNNSNRFLIVLYVSKNNVVPIFIADKKERMGKNISANSSIYYKIAKNILMYIQDGGTYTVETIELEVDKVTLGGTIVIFKK
jgi:hypothetical protein